MRMLTVIIAAFAFSATSYAQIYDASRLKLNKTKEEGVYELDVSSIEKLQLPINKAYFNLILSKFKSSGVDLNNLSKLEFKMEGQKIYLKYNGKYIKMSDVLTKQQIDSLRPVLPAGYYQFSIPKTVGNQYIVEQYRFQPKQNPNGDAIRLTNKSSMSVSLYLKYSRGDEWGIFTIRAGQQVSIPCVDKMEVMIFTQQENGRRYVNYTLERNNLYVIYIDNQNKIWDIRSDMKLP